VSLDYQQEREMIAAYKRIGFLQDRLTGGFKRASDSLWVSWAQAVEEWGRHLDGRVLERDQVKPESETLARFVEGQE
jgi:hypothetical protein